MKEDLQIAYYVIGIELLIIFLFTGVILFSSNSSEMDYENGFKCAVKDQLNDQYDKRGIGQKYSLTGQCEEMVKKFENKILKETIIFGE